MAWWQIILYPFSLIYDGLTRLRNHLFDRGLQPSFDFLANVISVGNLEMGGTGKSPMIEYMTDRFLKESKKLALLSRGYGRKTKGFLVVNSKDTARTVGDEPLSFYRSFGDRALVTVGEDRALSIPEILYLQSDLDIILMDDAFQHRTVKPSYSILLTTHSRPFYSDFVVPSGRLREARKGAERADCIVVTKCPKNLKNSEMLEHKQGIAKYNNQVKVFFTSVSYLEIEPLFNKPKPMKTRVVAVSGIANPDPFHEHLKSNFEYLGALEYEDHHTYIQRDIESIAKVLEEEKAMLVTTTKDGVKLSQHEILRQFPCYVLPIGIKFLSEEDVFWQNVTSSLKNYPQQVSDY